MKEAGHPNEVWQLGITEYRGAKFIAAIDDYSRFCFGIMPFDEITPNEVNYFLADVFNKGNIPEKIITKKAEPFFNQKGESNLRELFELTGVEHIPASKEYGTQKLAAFFRTFRKMYSR